MVTGLNQFPAILPLIGKEILQPSDPTLKRIMRQAMTCLIAFNNVPGFIHFGQGKFVDRDLIFPDTHGLSIPSSV
jgi:hypothetical protein